MQTKHAIRRWLGERLMDRALAILPADEWRKWVTANALSEYRRYERYVALCQLQCRRAVSIDVWRDEARRYGLL